MKKKQEYTLSGLSKTFVQHSVDFEDSIDGSHEPEDFNLPKAFVVIFNELINLNHEIFLLKKCK